MSKSITSTKFVINRTPRSLAAQNFDGVRAQRAKHGRQCGNERTEQHGTRRRSDHIRVGCFDLVGKRLNIARRDESERDARAASKRDHLEDIESHNAHDASTSRANRHADTDLAAALQDRVVEDSVESDAGEEQRDGGKESGEHGDQTLANGLVADKIELRGDVGNAQAVVALRDELAEGVGEGERVLGVGVNGEGGEVDDTGGGFGVDFVEGDVEDGAAGLAQVVVWDVGSDADNFVDRVIGTAFKGAADGVLAGEEGLDEGFVDDGGSRRGVFRAKVAAGNEGDLHRREPARRNVQQPGRSRAGRRAVDGDVAVYADAPEKRPARDGDRVDAGGGTKRLGSLIPDYGELAFAGDGFQQEQTVGGETEGAVLQALEGCDEERREKEDEETESDLKSDGSPHETAWRVRILTTFERGDGPDGGGTESRKQTKQYNDQENEPEAEEKHTPVGGKGEARRVVGRIDEAEHKGR